MDLCIEISEPWELGGDLLYATASDEDVLECAFGDQNLTARLRPGSTVRGQEVTSIVLHARHVDDTLSMLSAGQHVAANARATVDDRNVPPIRLIVNVSRIK